MQINSTINFSNLNYQVITNFVKSLRNSFGIVTKDSFAMVDKFVITMAVNKLVITMAVNKLEQVVFKIITRKRYEYAPSYLIASTKFLFKPILYYSINLDTYVVIFFFF